jgi:enolase
VVESEDAFKLLHEAIRAAGHSAIVQLGIDAAASEFYN